MYLSVATFARIACRDPPNVASGIRRLGTRLPKLTARARDNKRLGARVYLGVFCIVNCMVHVLFAFAIHFGPKQKHLANHPAWKR